MTETKKLQFNKSPKLAYMGFLFQTFFKRPFGYIIGILYVVYLSVILLIVPAVTKQHPLFIWNISAFNMPIFNLFFIAAATSSVAVAIFRVGREDGTDLSLSAKPLTKGDTVGIKTIVYILIMLMFSLIALISVLLLLPVFGEYNILDNPTGITMDQYRGIILSVTIGNIVNMFLFGAISIFICMVGGQVITMIGTIAIAFVLCMMNFIYPQVISSATDYIERHCNSSLLSINANTLNQYGQDDAKPYSYTSIQCYADDEGHELEHFDTKQYWDLARSRTGTNVINYVDIGKQLSGLYSSFGLENMKLEDAKQMAIDSNSEFNYNVIANTSVGEHGNIEAKEYPIAIYDVMVSQGKTIPRVVVLGGNVGEISLENWYLMSKIYHLDFDSVIRLSDSCNPEFHFITEEDLEQLENKNSFKMNEIYLNTDQKKQEAERLWNEFSTSSLNDEQFRDWLPIHLREDTSGIFFEGPWSNVSPLERFKIISSIHLYWAILAQQKQNQMIIDVVKEQTGSEPQFPFKSSDILIWQKTINDGSHMDIRNININIVRLFTYGIYTDNKFGPEDEPRWYFSKLVTGNLPYAETYANMYQYTVSNFYSIPGLITVWSIVSIMLLSASIVIYKKTDFK